MGRRQIIAMLASVSLLGVPALAEAGPKRERKLEIRVAALKLKLERVRDQRDSARADNTSLHTSVEALTSERDNLRSERDALRADNAVLISQRDDALKGLPDAISAVPLDEFWPLVFTPAREAWPCDSYYTSDGYWSVSFDSTSFCF